MLKPATHFALTGLLFLGASVSAAFAQTAPAASDAPPPPPGMHGHHMRPPDPDKQLARMTSKLNLSADQQAQIKPILEDRNTQMAALHADTSLGGPDKMAKMKSIGQESQTKIDAVLNDQQKAQWAEMKAKQREKMQQRMQERGGAQGQDAPPPPPQ